MEAALDGAILHQLEVTMVLIDCGKASSITKGSFLLPFLEAGTPPTNRLFYVGPH